MKEASDNFGKTDRDDSNQAETSGLRPGVISRRNFLAVTAGMAAAGCSQTAAIDGNARIAAAEANAARIGAAPQAPFDTLREYVAALEAYGLLLRFDKVDQDAFEGTAIVYALIDKYGWYEAPAVLFENVKQDGVWVKGPVLINHQGHWDTECITFGLEPDKYDSTQSYRNALAYTRGLLGRRTVSADRSRRGQPGQGAVQTSGRYGR